MIRPAVLADTDALVGLIHDLAEYERSPEQVRIDRDALANALFAEHPTVFAHVAEQRGEVVGMAIWFLNFSTWTGRNGIYLEDLYVRPDCRGSGIGRQLLTELAHLAVEAGYGRIDWSVLTWNKPALGFYRALGAGVTDEWVGYRLAGEGLEALAASDHGPA
jgi:ribosomal protein S18 acetylase RimI-like enzyme